MHHLLDYHCLQPTKIWILMPETDPQASNHENQDTSLYFPCSQLLHPTLNVISMIFGISIEYSPQGHWKQHGTALGLSLGPYPSSKNGQYCSGSAGASGSSHCRCSWNPEKACPNPTEGMDGISGVDQRSIS